MKNAIKIWEAAMKAGRWTGCHQMPERSFFFKKYQFPVCARCTGVLVGYVFAFFSWMLYIKLWLSVLCCTVMFVDWYIQYLGWVESTNFRRLITGILGGYGILSMQIILIMSFIKLL